MNNHISNTDKKVQHTPTPWGFEKINYDAYSSAIRTIDPLSKELNGGSFTVAHLAGANGVAEANAEFIVRAVNSHEVLLSALRSVRNEYRSYILNDPNNLQDSKGSRILAQIDYAISEAEGRKLSRLSR